MLEDRNLRQRPGDNDALLLSYVAVILVIHRMNGSIEHTCTLSSEWFQVDEFLPFLPVITGLRTAGMRDRHWDQLSEKLGVDLHPDDNYTLTMCVITVSNVAPPS